MEQPGGAWALKGIRGGIVRLEGTAPVDLYFGPSAPVGQEAHWIKTSPGKGWFVYFRVYGSGSVHRRAA